MKTFFVAIFLAAISAPAGLLSGMFYMSVNRSSDIVSASALGVVFCLAMLIASAVVFLVSLFTMRGESVRVVQTS